MFSIPVQSTGMALVLDVGRANIPPAANLGVDPHPLGVSDCLWYYGLVWYKAGIWRSNARAGVRWALSNDKKSADIGWVSVGHRGYSAMAFLVFSSLDCSLWIDWSLDDYHRRGAFTGNISRRVREILPVSPQIFVEF